MEVGDLNGAGGLSRPSLEGEALMVCAGFVLSSGSWALTDVTVAASNITVARNCFIHLVPIPVRLIKSITFYTSGADNEG